MLKSLLMASALSMAFSSTAMAATAQGNLTADNYAVAVLEVDGVSTIIANSAGNWPTVRQFSFNIPDSAMRSCTIRIIAWGDGSSAQGIAAYFTGIGGSINTGPGGAFQLSSVPNSVTGGFPASPSVMTVAQTQTIVSAPATPVAPSWTSLPVGVGGITGTWGPVTMPLAGSSPSAYNPNFTFIWDGNANTLGANRANYRVATAPCSSIQPPVEPPVPMPGNHWSCYRVVEGPTLKPETLTVQDQFGKAQIVLARPVMLCNPSNKVHGKAKYGVENPERHLVCYQPVKQSDQQAKRKVKINNQMAPATLVVADREMFCVPSSKKRLDAPDQPVGVPMD
jgi:hypothetical protein